MVKKLCKHDYFQCETALLFLALTNRVRLSCICISHGLVIIILCMYTWDGSSRCKAGIDACSALLYTFDTIRINPYPFGRKQDMQDYYKFCFSKITILHSNFLKCYWWTNVSIDCLFLVWVRPIHLTLQPLWLILVSNGSFSTTKLELMYPLKRPYLLDRYLNAELPARPAKVTTALAELCRDIYRRSSG